MTTKVNISNYDYKKTLKKMARSFAIVFLTGLIVISQDDLRYAAIIPLAEGALNWLKNK